MTDKEFFALLKRAGDLEVKRLLESDEAFDKFLVDNPLTPVEEAEVKVMVERMAARFRNRNVK